MADPNILSYYDPAGYSRTEVKGSFPTIIPMTARDQLMALIDKESGALPRALPRMAGPTAGATVKRSAQRPMAPPREGPAQTVDPLAAQRAQDQYDMQLLSAAKRPVGLGPQMIPGMAVDPTLLPPRLRPQQSSFQNIAGPSMAGLPDEPQVRQQPPSSNSGFDYLPAVEQARWLAAYGRSLPQGGK